MSVDILSVTLRAASFVLLFQAAGIVLFLTLQDHELRSTGRALRGLAVVSPLAAAILLIAQYVLEAARMSGELGGALDPALQGLVLRSATSATLACRLLGLLLIAWGLRHRATEGSTVGVIGMVILLAAFALVGHTANSAQRWLLSPVLLVHLMVVAF